VRADLELAIAATEAAEERARAADVRLGQEAELRKALEAQNALLEGDARSSVTLRETAEAAARGAEARVAELLRSNAEGAAAIEARHRSALVALRVELEKEIRARAVLHAAAEERAIKLAKAVTAHEARIAELDARLGAAHQTTSAENERAVVEANARIKELERTLFEKEQITLQRVAEYEAAQSALREKLTAASEAREADREHLDAGRRRELAELAASWELRLAASVEDMRKTLTASHDAELDALLERFVRIEDDRAEIQRGFDQGLKELEEAMARTRAQLEDERQAHAVTRTTGARTVDALGAQVASKDEAIQRLEREADEARGEMPELEAEIVVLRSELLSLRRELDAQVVGARAAGAELERRVDLLYRAEKLLDDGKDDGKA
jgi:hypothetical protein